MQRCPDCNYNGRMDNSHVCSNGADRIVAPRVSRAALSITAVSLDRLSKRALNCLHREINELLRLTSKGKLSREDAAALSQYAKLIHDLRKNEAKELAGLSDEELAKRAR